MKRLFVALFLMAFALYALDIDLSKFGTVRGCKAVFEDGVLVITDIKRDHSVTYENLDINPLEYNVAKVVYCAEGFEDISNGELFYAPTGKGFENQLQWQVGGLRADGKWRETELLLSTSVAREGWESCGKVAKLRLDMTNSEGKCIKVRSLTFSKEEVREGAQTWYWSVEGEPPKMTKPYFQGLMVRNQEENDKPEDGKNYPVRRSFTVKNDVQEAFLQFMGDDAAVAYVNGVKVASNINWKVPTVVEVTDKLVKGENMLAFTYRNAISYGGVLCELYVRFTNGESMRVNSDELFQWGASMADGWNKVGAPSEGWAPVVTMPAAPCAPWTTVLAYVNYDNPAELLSIFTDKQEYAPGETCRATLQLRGRMPLKAPLFDIVLHNETNRYEYKELTGVKQMLEAEGGASWQYELEFKMPIYAPNGDYMVDFSTQEFMVKGEGGKAKIHYNQKPLPAERTVAEVRQLGPNAVIHVNGKPFYSIGSNGDRLKELYANTISVSGHTVFWTGIDEYTFAEVDSEVESVLAGKPDAYLLMGMELYPPADWAKMYPDDMCANYEGGRGYYYRTMYSNSSKRAREDMQKTIRVFIDHCENSAYRDRIIGYRLHGGTTIEWLGWGHFHKSQRYDYSPVAKESFKRFTAKYYPFLNGELPTPEQTLAFDGNLLLDSKKDALRIAHNDFISFEEADLLAALAQTAKEAAHGRKLIGAYYGYTCFLPILTQIPETAHLCLKKLMETKTLDFLMSPHDYNSRWIGETSADMKPITTMEQNGIVPILENDSRTNGYAKKYNPKERYPGDYGQAINPWHLLQLNKRDIGIAVVRRQPFMIAPYLWSRDFQANEIAVPSRAAAVAGQWTVEHDVKRRAEIAIVVSENSFKYMPYIRNGAFYKKRSFMFDVFTGQVRKRKISGLMFTGALVTRLCQDTSYLGAPADFVLAEDLKDHIGDYKMWIFANCFAVDEAFVKAVRAIQNTDATLLWLYAPGYFQNGTDGVENMKALTGFTYRRVEGKRIPTMEWGVKVAGEPGDSMCPSFEVVPAENDEVRGAYEDNGAPCLVQRKVGRSRNIYCGINAPGNEVIKQLASEAGVRFYTDDNDAFDCNDAFFTLHACETGKKTIRFPKACDVVDVYNRMVVARNVDTFTFEAAIFTSHLFYYGEKADELLKLLK